MKIFVLINAILTVSVQGQTAYEWTGSMRDLIGRAKLEQEDILEITERIFNGMPPNCARRIRAPNKYDLPSPNQPCDMDIMKQMGQEMLKPKFFNAEKFLSFFWSSAFGKALKEEMKRRGVSENNVKQSMRQLWFSETKNADTAFNRLFLGTDTLGEQNTKRFDSWYTFDFARQNLKDSKCEITVHGTSLPVFVDGKCGDQIFKSYFIFPSHPFIDLVVYSLCAWTVNPQRSETRDCPAKVPGSNEVIPIHLLFQYDSTNTLYLADVFPDYSPIL